MQRKSRKYCPGEKTIIDRDFSENFLFGTRVEREWSNFISSVFKKGPCPLLTY